MLRNSLRLAFDPSTALALGMAIVAMVSCAVSTGPLFADEPGRGYYRQPALAGSTLVFVAEGDLWRVDLPTNAIPTEGSLEARRLTTHPGDESWPVLSADGTHLAFTARYEGPREVYVMPTDGGLPRRLTYEGGTGRSEPRAVGFDAEGRVLVATQALSGLPDTQLVLIEPETGHAEPVPLAQAADGVFSAEGRLYFQRLPFHRGSHAKRYQGGTVRQLWRFDPASADAESGSREAVPLTADYAGASAEPALWNGRLYFLSDRPGTSDPDGTMNIWSLDPDRAPASSDLRQHTDHVGWDAKGLAVSSGLAVYQLGADLHIHDLTSGEGHRLDIRFASDFDQQRERWLAEPLEYLTAVHLSPDGSRVVLTARGEVFVMPTGEGRRVHVTRAPDVRYRQARFLPDGTLAALSDASGEVEWWRLSADGTEAPERWTRDGRLLRHNGTVSPDGLWLATHDHDGVLRLYSADSGEGVKVAQSPAAGLDGRYTFSPDSRWLAYATFETNGLSRLWLYDIEGRNSTPLTSDRFRSFSPTWDPDGDWLFFVSNRHFRSSVGSPWGERAPQPHFANTSELYALALRPGVRWPFQAATELDGEGARDEKDEKDEGSDASTDSATTPISIELPGIAKRLYRVPVAPGEYFALEATESRLLWLASSDRDGNTLRSLAFGSDEEVVSLAHGLVSFQLSADRQKLLLRRGFEAESRFAVADTPANGASEGSLNEAFDQQPVDLGDWAFPFDPREEWRQMFADAWRLHRDYFYDRGMHGVDWPAMREKYGPLVERITHRRELSDLFAQLISELSALHASVRGGDHRRGPDDIPTAFLGARLVRDAEAGGYRVEHVHRADPELPEAASPLARPGVDIGEGTVLTAIDGVPTLERAPGAALRHTAGRQVRLSLTETSGNTREAIVRPIDAGAMRELRYAEWEYERRLRVEQSSEGRIGYVHLRAMGSGDIAQWQRDYFPNIDRQGMVLDMRHNRGGNIDSWILGQLLRRAWMYWQGPSGEPTWNMQHAFRGHLVMLVDSWTGSDGEAVAEGFRRLGLGPVIGTRTWGGEIWLTGSNSVVDGGVATAAEFGVYGPEGVWLIEGHGVDPDQVVDNPPHATFRGEDAQLDAALRYLERKIAEDPRPVPPAPPHPDLSVPDNRPTSDG